MSKGNIIICPGGGYFFLSPRESEPVACAFESLGLKADILHYDVRQTPTDAPLFNTPVEQLSQQITSVRRKNGGAPVFVCGFSAGGHVAATLGVHWRTLGLERPDALILGYPVITAEPGLTHESSIQHLSNGQNREFYSLEKHVSLDTPPTFLWHTAADESVPAENSLRFAAALGAAGVPYELHIYPFGVHGLSLATEEVREPEKNRLPDSHVAGWIRECGEWIDTILPYLSKA